MNLLSKAKKILSERRILSIDLGSHEIKIIEGRNTKKGLILDNFSSILMPRGAYMDGKIIDPDSIISTMESKLRLGKNKNTYFTINSSRIITRDITIPKLEIKEVKKILSFQIEEYIPKAQEEYLVQPILIDTIYENDTDFYHVLIIAMPRDIIKSHWDLAKDLGLTPKVLDYQPNSISKLIYENQRVNDSYPIKNISFATIDLGYSNSNVSIIKDGLVQVSRVIKGGGDELDHKILNIFDYSFEELEEKKRSIGNINEIRDENSESSSLIDITKMYFKNLNEKIESVFNYYLTRKEDNRIDIILLLGGLSNIKGLPNLYSNDFNIPTIRLESLNDLDFNDQVSIYGNSIGALIRKEEVEL